MASNKYYQIDGFCLFSLDQKGGKLIWKRNEKMGNMLSYLRKETIVSEKEQFILELRWMSQQQ